MSPTILIFPPAEWPRCSAEHIQAAIESVLRKRASCNVMLTGGRSAAALYAAWVRTPAFDALSNVDFYVGDERCVPPDHSESNSHMIRSSLFAQGVPAGCRFIAMNAFSADQDGAARHYEKILPNEVDILLLSIGEDGHVASLFPESLVLEEKERRVVPVVGPKYPSERLTITPLVITNARKVFLLAQGACKADVLSRALKTPVGVQSLPVGLAMNATWLLDEPISDQLENYA